MIKSKSPNLAISLLPNIEKNSVDRKADNLRNSIDNQRPANNSLNRMHGSEKETLGPPKRIITVRSGPFKRKASKDKRGESCEQTINNTQILFRDYKNSSLLQESVSSTVVNNSRQQIETGQVFATSNSRMGIMRRTRMSTVYSNAKHYTTQSQARSSSNDFM